MSSTSTTARPCRLLCLNGLFHETFTTIVPPSIFGLGWTFLGVALDLFVSADPSFFFAGLTRTVSETSERPSLFHDVESRLHVAVKLKPNVSTDTRKTRTFGYRKGDHARQSIGQADVRGVQGCAT